MVVKQIDPQHPRFATLKSLSLADGSVPCLIGEKQGNRLLIETQSAVTPFTTATVQFDDALFLGEIISARSEGETFTLEIKIEQVLSGLQSLMALRTRLLGNTPAVAPSASPFAFAQQSPVLAGRV